MRSGPGPASVTLTPSSWLTPAERAAGSAASSPPPARSQTHSRFTSVGFLLTYFSLQEEQIASGKSYSDFSQSNFDCGRYKLLADINGNVDNV